MHPDCIHNQSKLDQMKEGRELPRLLHIDAHGATRIELTKCRQARPDFAAPPPADRCRPVDGLRTSSTDNTDP